MSHPDPKGCVRDGVVVQRVLTAASPTAAVPDPSLDFDGVERDAIEKRFARFEGPADSPVLRTVEILSAQRSERDSIYVLFVAPLRKGKCAWLGSDVSWVTGDGDLVATLSAVPRDAILEVEPDAIKLRGLEDTLRMRDAVLETSVRYLDHSELLCEGHFEAASSQGGR
jgi:hypothetical protein